MTHRLAAQAARTLATALLICTASVASHAQPAPVEPSVPYTVAPGEKLILLASRILIKPSDWNEVARFNRMKDPDVIRPGQTINIPLRLLKSQAVSGKIVQLQGDVQLAGASAALGTAFNEGDKLQTGANSLAVVELNDGSRVTLQPNTSAEMVASRRFAARDAASSASTGWFSGLVRLAQGTLETLASKTARRATPLSIETPTSLVGVRGTEFRVAYEDPASKNARTEVLEGKVQADNPAQGSGAELPQGFGAIVNPAVREVSAVALLKAPDLSTAPAEILKPAGLWSFPAVDLAARYRVQISADAAFATVERNVLVPEPTIALPDLAPGAWFARVRGIDGNGLEGYDGNRAVQVVQGPPRLSFTDQRLDMNAGRHLLSFRPAGLDASHTVVATVTEDAPPYTQLAQATARGNQRRVSLDLGVLEARKVYRLNLDVTQPVGAPAVTQRYRFRALDFTGWAENTLEAVPAGTP